MTLLELTEPLFQYICRLNRLGRCAGAAAQGDSAFFTKGATSAGSLKGISLDYHVVRAEIKAQFEDLMRKAGSDHRLEGQIKTMEMTLIFFVDSMISESALPFASQWNQNRLAYDRNELAGDEKFFDLLEETMKDPSPDASERLAIYYSCIGLGFSGIYFNQPEYLRKTMLTIAPRIRDLMETDHSARICPDAYEGVDTRDLVQPPGSRMVLVVIIFLCFSLAALTTYFLLYREASKNLSTAMEEILRKDLKVQQP
jgi:type VI protein secretion system component VasF